MKNSETNINMKSSETNRITEKKIQLKRKGSLKKKQTLSRTKTISNKPSISKKVLENPISVYPKLYGQPILVTQKPQNIIIINQQLPSPVAPVSFTMSPVEITCPYCLNKISSKVNRYFNCCACLMYLLVFLLCALPLLICSHMCNPNCNVNCDCDCCCDAEHFCPNCGKSIGKYDSSKIC